ncbi:MAG: glycosyltransferase family 2 protein [Bacteroidota bacterium]
MIKVSVIVPNYNHAKFLPKRLESIFNQTYEDFEVILLDDCSNDDSVSILNSYTAHPKVSHFVVNTENSGSPFKQWKKGIELAKGSFIWIAESDDYCSPFLLEKIISFINCNKEELGLVYTQTVDVNEKGEEIFDRIKYTSGFDPNIWQQNYTMPGTTFIENYLKVKNVIPNASAVLFKKALVDDSIFSNELVSMRMAGDWLFWIKILPKTHIGFIAETLNYFRNHKNVTRNHNSKEKLFNRVMEERNVRSYLKNRFGINQEAEWNNLHKMWFKSNKFSSIFFRRFYALRLPGVSVLSYLKKYICVRLS